MKASRYNPTITIDNTFVLRRYVDVLKKKPWFTEKEIEIAVEQVKKLNKESEI